MIKLRFKVETFSVFGHNDYDTVSSVIKVSDDKSSLLKYLPHTLKVFLYHQIDGTFVLSSFSSSSGFKLFNSQIRKDVSEGIKFNFPVGRPSKMNKKFENNRFPGERSPPPVFHPFRIQNKIVFDKRKIVIFFLLFSAAHR